MDDREDSLKQVEFFISEAVPKSVSLTQSSVSFGLSAIRGIFFLNGSAAVAVLAKQPELDPSGQGVVLWGAIGAGVAVLCSAFAYLSQLFFARGFDRDAVRQIKALVKNEFVIPKTSKAGWSCYALALVSFVFSFACFVRAFVGFFEAL